MQALSWVGVCLQVILGALFLAKCALYPSKVRHPYGVLKISFAFPPPACAEPRCTEFVPRGECWVDLISRSLGR